MPYKGKPFLNGNPVYKELHYNGNYVIQGEPLINIRGNRLQREDQLYKEIPYKGKPLIQGNPLHVETLVK